MEKPYENVLDPENQSNNDLKANYSIPKIKSTKKSLHSDNDNQKPTHKSSIDQLPDEIRNPSQKQI